MPSDFALASKLDNDWQNGDDWALYSSGKFEGDMDIDVIELTNVSSFIECILALQFLNFYLKAFVLPIRFL